MCIAAGPRDLLAEAGAYRRRRPREGTVSGRRGLGELEAVVLAALASNDHGLTAGTVRGLVAQDLAYTTVATILNRLCEKGLVTRQREGRSYRYVLAVDEAGLIGQRMRVQLRHANDRVGALGQFVSGLDPAEEQALRRVLEELDREP